MPVFIVIYLFFIGLAALLAEMILPVIFSNTAPIFNALGFSSAFVPLVVIYASLELGDERAPILAGILGLLLDLMTSHHLGISTLALSGMSVLIISQAHKPQAHLWFFRLTFVLVGTFSFLLFEYILTLVQMEQFAWSIQIWSKITFASLLNVALAPLFFYAAGFLPRLCGWRPFYEVKDRRYQAY